MSFCGFARRPVLRDAHRLGDSNTSGLGDLVVPGVEAARTRLFAHKDNRGVLGQLQRDALRGLGLRSADVIGVRHAVLPAMSQRAV